MNTFTESNVFKDGIRLIIEMLIGIFTSKAMKRRDPIY